MEPIYIEQVFNRWMIELQKQANDIDTNIENPLREQFLRVTSNLNHFQMNVPSNPKDFFSQVLFYRKAASFDQEHLSQIRIATINGQIDKDPTIYVTFHLGPFRMASYLLFLNNINFCMPVTQDVVEEQRSTYYAIHQSLKDQNQTTSQFEVINAEETKSSLSLIRELKKGHSLLFYIDGNSGVGGMGRNDDKLTLVNLLGNQIYSRKGIGFISHFTNTPIKLMIPYYNSNHLACFDIQDPIFPDLASDRSEYANGVTQLIWNRFSPYLETYTSQWEGWFYANCFMKTPTVEPELALTQTEYEFNSSRFDFFRNDTHYLFDKTNNRSYKITQGLYKILAHFKNDGTKYSTNLIQKLIPNELFQDMLVKQVFV